MEIPLSGPDITDADIAAVTSVLRTPHLSLGPRLIEFERVAAAYLNTPHTLAVSSGTCGLHLCVRGLGLEAGDEVITTPFSFIASANVLLFEGVVPVFVDIDPATRNLDPRGVEAAITPRTRGIMAVHAFGFPADMDALQRIAQRHGLVLIEDACEALGTLFKGRMLGTLGDAGVFGFYPNKQITTGEGGLIAMRDGALARRLGIMRNQGRDPDLDWLDQTELGYNYRLSEMNCALGIAQLGRIEEILAKREAAAATYTRLLDQVEGVDPPPQPPADCRMSWFVYVVRLADRFSRPDRDRIAAALIARGIGCGRYFAPIHLQPYYRARFGYAPDTFPHTERLTDRTLALPFFSNITPAQIERVCGTLGEIIASK